MIASLSRLGIGTARRRPLAVFALLSGLALCALLLASPVVRAAGSGPPVNTALPAVKGTPKVGKKLKATKGKWTGSKTITYSYQWQACNSSGEVCSNINEATSTSYVPTAGQVGDTVRVVVTGTNTLGKATATSPPSKQVASSAKAARVDLCGTIAKSETLSPSAAYIYVLTCPVTVPAKVILTIAPGTIIKAEAGASVMVDGTLTSHGTSGSPVTLTSINDNSLGGETGLLPPEPGNWGGIEVRTGGSVTLEGATIDYAGNGVHGSGNLAGLSVIGSTIKDSQNNGIFTDSEGAAPVITGSTITGSGGPAAEIYSTNLDASKLSGNSGSGNHGGMQLAGTIAHSGTITEAGLIPEVGVPWTGSLLQIASGATVTIPAGQVWKGGPLNSGRMLMVEGALITHGTSGSPVTFTSAADNSVGGETGGGGNAKPEPGNWGGIEVRTGGSVTLEGATIDYASTALTVAEDAEATVHGAILNSTVGVSASDSYVDASGVDWGSPSGPSPIGTGTPIRGEGVYVTPWVGYVAPPRPAPVSFTPATFNNCTKFVVISARGSGEAPQGDPPSYSSNEDGMGARGYNAFYGLRQRMEAFGYSASDFKLLGLRYRALGVLFNPFNFGTEAYFESIYEGVESLTDELFEQASKCPSQRAILAGYSQGALVVHLALRELAQSDPSMLSSSRIAGVMLIADPAKVSHESEPVWEEENVPAPSGSGVDKADGVWTKAGLPGQGPLPSAVTGRSISFCANHDIVCAPGFGSHASVHTGYYTATPMNAMGEWMAGRILGLN